MELGTMEIEQLTRENIRITSVLVIKNLVIWSVIFTILLLDKRGVKLHHKSSNTNSKHQCLSRLSANFNFYPTIIQSVIHQ